ncbi:putative disease resistance protein RGA3 [Sorghum bicolor]|uniref:putative disease resistance protein RGA3 n=1 Tax=Sorghum bicolor TaxID=4558 RepID=UPI000B42599F|nr:putative disease resistance protein RGA3 [Sorghum bicolor]|eukprot:XP_021319175.1 putative disease resistance protein RGA3 [Sorghum bicolor]
MTPIAIGEWMASACIAMMVSKVCSYLEDQFEYQMDDAKDKLAKLKKIPFVLKTASSLPAKDPSMKSWLASIKGAAYQAEDVLDLFDYRFLEAKAEDMMANSSDYVTVSPSSSTISATTNTTASTSTSSSSTVKRSVRILKRLFFSDEDLNKLIAIVDKFDKIASEMQTFLELADPRDRKPGKALQWRRTTSILGATNFFGRGGEETKLKKLLEQTNDEYRQPYSVIAIVGVAGVGKTALLQRVYNHFRDIGHFDIMAWLYVSEKFGVKRLTKEMVHRVSWDGSISADLNSISNLDLVQRKLQKKLNGSKILVVLDDVWNEMSSKWETLLKPLQFASMGSKVVLTTRSQKVAKINGATEIIHLDGLKRKDYLDHFQQCAFGNARPSDFPRLVEIGEQLAMKLAGSPLAAKTVGGELKLKLDEDHWKAVLQLKLWQIEQTEDDIMPALRLSYEHLPDHLKQCFVYFALFPKNYQLRGDVLIQMWRAHGYIQKETSDENAYRYIDDLLQLSFIKKAANLENHYVVHDLLHDLAESLSNGEHFRIEDDFHVTIPRNVRHLYVNASNISKVYMSLVESQESLVESQDLKKNLRSLIICKHHAPSGERIPPDNFNNVLKETLHELRSLRVLVLQHPDGILPDNIEPLVHLRYLDICDSRIFTSIPKSLFKLYHLQGFILQSHCQRSIGKELQKHISRLTAEPVKILRLDFKQSQKEL